MKKVITAIGNPILNKELKKQENINIITNDIKYKEELLEKLLENKNIDYVIISEFIKGRIDLVNLLNKIKIINKKIKTIIILEKESYNLKERLESQKDYKIFIEGKTNIKEIIDYINNNSNNKINKALTSNYKKKTKLINIFKNNKTNTINKNLKDKGKIISVIGNPQVGKTTFILILSKLIKNKKILIIDCDFYFNEIQIILNTKKNQNYPIIKINKKINLYNRLDKNINKQNFVDLIKKLKDEFELIIFDCNYNNALFQNTLELADEILFLMEPNLLQIRKSKELINNKLKDKRELKDKIKIIINKNNIYSINKEIIENIFYDLKIIGVINYNKKYSNLINNYKCFKINNLQTKKIIKILKEKK